GWSNIERVAGGAAVDTFNVNGGGSINQIDGVGGTDTVTLTGSVNTIAGADLVINAAGAIGTAGNFQDLQVDSLTATAGGNVFLADTGNLLIKSINAGGNEVTLNVNGSINDFTPDTDTVVDITASRVVLDAGSGIGNSARLELATDLLNANSSSGDIRIVNTQALQIESLTAGNGSIQVAAVGELIIGDGTPNTTVVQAVGGDVALAADPTDTGEFDLIQRGGVSATSGTVLLLASGNVLADNPSNVVSVAQAPFVVDAQQTSLVAGGFIGSTDGLNQSNAVATTSNTIFVNQGGTGDAFLISGFGTTEAPTSGFDSNALFNGTLAATFQAALISSNSTVSNAAAGQASAAAGESQNNDASDEGYIDPALYDLALNIFDIIQPGIALPADQLEDGGADEGVGSLDEESLEIDETLFESDETIEEFDALDLGPEPEFLDEAPIEDDFNLDFDEPDLTDEFVPEPGDGGEDFNLEEFDEESLELEFEEEGDDLEEFDEEFDIDDLIPLTSLPPVGDQGMQVFTDNSSNWGDPVIILEISWLDDEGIVRNRS
ncbi:MAG: hypothetical protein VW985_11755, partial [Gammaproteobacteria bacterium]